MKHIESLTTAPRAPMPAPARTLLEWAQKGVVLNSFVNALAQLADVKVTLED